MITQQQITLPTLEYFNDGFDGQLAHGRAMAIRMVLYYTGVTYNDNRISMKEFQERK